MYQVVLHQPRLLFPQKSLINVLQQWTLPLRSSSSSMYSSSSCGRNFEATYKKSLLFCPVIRLDYFPVSCTLRALFLWANALRVLFKWKLHKRWKSVGFFQPTVWPYLVWGVILVVCVVSVQMTALDNNISLPESVYRALQSQRWLYTILYFIQSHVTQNITYSSGCIYYILLLPHRQIKYPVDFDDELKTWKRQIR